MKEVLMSTIAFCVPLKWELLRYKFCLFSDKTGLTLEAQKNMVALC